MAAALGATRPVRSPRSARTTPRRPWSACRCRRRRCGVHLVRHLGAGRVELDARSSPRTPGGELHQRGRRRRHGAVPAQRDGSVAAQRVVRDWERGGARRPGRRCSRRRPRPTGPVARRSTPTTRGSCRPGDMPARIAEPAPRHGLPVPASPAETVARASSRAWPRRSPQPWTAAAALSGRERHRGPRRRRRRAERAAVPAHRRRAGLPVLAGPSRRPRSATCWCRPAQHGAGVGRPRGPACPGRPHPRRPALRTASRPPKEPDEAPAAEAARPRSPAEVQEADAVAQGATAGRGADDRGPAADRQAAHAQGGVRLHRRRRGGRGLAWPGPGRRSRTWSSTRRSCATCPRSTPRATCSAPRWRCRSGSRRPGSPG